jgi:hypothetical protein
VAAGVRLRRVAISIAVREDDELARRAQIAHGQRLLRLRRVVVVERRNTVAAIRFNGANRSASFQ